MNQPHLSTGAAQKPHGDSTPNPRQGDSSEQATKLQVGVTFVDLSVRGLATTDQYQYNFLRYMLAIPRFLIDIVRSGVTHKTQILQGFNGIIQPGEMLLVLGRPGSGCSTFLKSLAGNIDGLEISMDSRVNYQGSQP